MKKFRIIWLVTVILVTVLYLGYQAAENKKEDSSVPFFVMEKDSLEVSIHDGDEVLLQGITALDEKDGDVTDSILIEKISNIYGGGKRLVTYVAFDGDNHVTSTEREITYTDYTSPRFSLTGSLRFRSGSTINLDEIIKVTDCLDGDISDKVKIQLESSISSRVTGIYEIIYQVTNSAGDLAELPIQYEIYQPQANEVTLNLREYLIYYDGDTDYGAYLESLAVGTELYLFSETGESAGGEDEDEEEGDTADDSTEGAANQIPRDRVNIQSYVNPEVPGVYPVYFYYESDSYVAAETMYVIVE